MIRTSFKPEDSINSHYLGILTEVARIVREEVSDFNKRFGCLILEDFGSVVEEQPWANLTGYYLQIRITPFDSHKPGVKEVAEKVVKRFSEMLKLERQPIVERDLENLRYTVTIFNNFFSIGD